MRAADILIGSVYLCRVSGKIVPVRVLTFDRGLNTFGRITKGWTCRNESTGREIVVRSCQRFRSEVKTEIYNGGLFDRIEATRKQLNGIPCIFKVGDFYEAFDTDAKLLADVCGLTLTYRCHKGTEIPMAGFPYHSLEVNLRKLLEAGKRVAVCELAENPEGGES